MATQSYAKWGTSEAEMAANVFQDKHGLTLKQAEKKAKDHSIRDGESFLYYWRKRRDELWNELNSFAEIDPEIWENWRQGIRIQKQINDVRVI